MESILIVAGENSGENYGADLVRQFKKINPAINFFGIGGGRMSEEGVELIFSLDELAVIGVFELTSRLPHLWKSFQYIKKVAKQRKPAAAVLIDSPDFNLRLAKFLKKLSIPTLYYISPTVWAWRKGRLKTIKKTIEKMLLIFPFELEIYKKHDIPAAYVGHPLKNKTQISLSKAEFYQKYGLHPQKKLISVLPGSRRSEIKYHMPVLNKALDKIKESYDAQFVLLLAENLARSYLADFIPKSIEETKILADDKYEAMAFSDLVLSSHGTANLEAALLETPLISFYRISPLTYNLGVKFIKIKNYSIVNILARKKIIPELVQKQFTADNIIQETKKILDSEERIADMTIHFRRIKAILGDKIASQNAAQELNTLIRR